MRVSEIFARDGGDWNGYSGYNGGLETYLPYGTVDKPGGYYPDTGRWTYVNPNSAVAGGGGRRPVNVAHTDQTTRGTASCCGRHGRQQSRSCGQ